MHVRSSDDVLAFVPLTVAQVVGESWPFANPIVPLGGVLDPPRGAPEGAPGGSRTWLGPRPGSPRGAPERAKNDHRRSEMVNGDHFTSKCPRKGAAEDYSFY